MSIETITTLITSVGFPIACTCVLFFLWNKEREEHKAEIMQLIEVVTNNNTLIKQVLDKL